MSDRRALRHRRGSRKAPAWLPLLRRPRRGCTLRLVQWIALALSVTTLVTALFGTPPLAAALAALGGVVVGAVIGPVIDR